MKNKKDLFAHCCSLGYWIIFIPLIVAIFSPQPWQDYLYVLFFFVISGACLLNFKRCKRVHCQITGWGFLGVGIIALLKVLEVLDISWDLIWGIFITITIVAFGIEFFHKCKKGTCYRK